ncbi:MAG: OadG family transporter subunit [Muribaculaceae bacterium]
MIKKLTTLLIALAFVTAVQARGDRKALRINEVMVENYSNVVDEYGNRSGWIEIFNGNFAPVDISSVFLSTDRNQPKMYPVPLGDERTNMGKRQSIIFFADNMPTRGTFHTSFVLRPGQENTVFLFDADGSLIDEVTVPATLAADQSYARSVDGEGEWQVRKGTNEEGQYITPGGENTIRDTNNRIDQFAEKDENGFALTIMAMGIVFTSLLVLCLCFYAIGEIGKYLSRVKKAKSQGIAVTELSRDDHDSGEEIAAITMALHQHFNVHDNESNLLTIRKIRRAYSPWSSKIYGINQIGQMR